MDNDLDIDYRCTALNLAVTWATACSTTPSIEKIIDTAREFEAFLIEGIAS